MPPTRQTATACHSRWPLADTNDASGEESLASAQRFEQIHAELAPENAATLAVQNE